MTGYTKLFNSIIGSTIWQEKPATKVVWITMLTIRDKGGVVEASVPGLAKLSGVSIEEAEVALEKFLSPDPYSSSPENEGRRIERVDGGWRILNHYKYQDKMSKDDIQERDRIRQRHYRAQKSCHAEGVTKCDISDKSRMSRHKDLDVHQPQSKEKPILSAHPKDERGENVDRVHTLDERGEQLRGGDSSRCKEHAAKRAMLASGLYHKYPRKVGKARALKAISKAIPVVANRGATDKNSDFAGDETAATHWLAGRVDLFADSPQGRRADKTFIPYPASWFSDARYDDEAAEWNHIGSESGTSTKATSQAIPRRSASSELQRQLREG